MTTRILITFLGWCLLAHTTWTTSSDAVYIDQEPEPPIDPITSGFYLEQYNASKRVLQTVPCDPVNPTVVSYIDCRGLNDGAYQDPTTKNCSEYFRCHKQQRINCSCGPELIFDTSRGTCSSGSQSPPCPHYSNFGTCAYKPDGFYIVSGTSCKKYYHCSNGHRADFHCSSGMIFDIHHTNSCVEEPLSKCTTDNEQENSDEEETEEDEDEMQSEMPIDVCVGKPDGKYSTQNPGRQRFHVCHQNVLVSEGTCIDGHLFNQQLQKCVRPADPSVAHCTDLQDGYYPNIRTQCSTYYNCRDNKVLFEITCPESMKFDLRLQVCLHASKARCVVFPELEGKGQVQGSENDCADKSDGYYPVISSRCKEFYNCKNHQKVSQLHCSHGDAFDINMRRCIAEDMVRCNNTLLSRIFRGNNDTFCTGQPDGYYPNYHMNCTRFFRCKNGEKTVEMTCHVGERFDPQTKKCEPSSAVICHKTSNSTGPCSNKKDGYFGDPSTGCKNYFVCRTGRIIMNLTCAHGQAYDDGEEKCVPFRQVHCQSQDTKPSSNVSHTIEKNVCQGKKEGFYPNYENACRTYYHCRTGRKPLEYKCNGGELFDSVTSQCVNESNVLCGVYVDRCNFKQDGYYPAYAKGCKSYYYCRNQIRISYLTCPERQIFDANETTCLDETVTTCRQDNITDDCQGKQDGYYGNYAVNCSAFYRCLKGIKLKSLSCPSETCFDQVSSGCIKSLTEINCGLVPDGYYVDQLSSCKNYQWCNGGLLHTERCPGNTVFDLNTMACKAQKNQQYCKQIWTYSCKNQKDGVYENVYSRDRKTVYVCRGGNLIRVGTAKRILPITARDSIFFECQHLRDGFYLDISEVNCSRYHVCKEGHLVRTTQCPDGQRFHFQDQKCREWEEVQCDTANPVMTKSQLSSSSKTVSFHFHFQNGCSNVTLCFKTRQSFLAQCPEADDDSSSLSYSNTRRYCKIGNIAEISPSSGYDGDSGHHEPLSVFDCKKKEDGYYTDPASDCRKWHMCDAERSYTYECETGKAFNILHKRCDDSTLVTCVTESWVYRNYSSARSLPSSFRSQTQDFRKQPTIPNHSPECYGRSDGIYVDIGDVSTTCFRVYLCISKQLYAISCPFEENPISDEEGGVTCKVKDDVKCMKGGSSDETNARINPPGASSGQTETSNQTCENQDDGFYVDVVGGCRSFYVCHQGAIKSYQCPDSMMFNTETKTCDYPENVICLIQATNAIRCPKHLTKLYPDHESGCQYFFGCSGGSFRYSACPYGTIFDFKTSECAFRNEAVCVNAVVLSDSDTVVAQPSSLIDRRLATPILPEPTPTYVTQSSFDCSGRPDGFYPDYDQNCHVFYRCVRGKKFSHYCQIGQLFNSQLQSCDFQENVQCHNQDYVSVS